MTKIIIKKDRGDDTYSWAIFRSDRKKPCFSGLLKKEVPYYRDLVQKQIEKEKEAWNLMNLEI